MQALVDEVLQVTEPKAFPQIEFADAALLAEVRRSPVSVPWKNCFNGFSLQA
jgi:hypothetical protein